jgi:putative transposase
MVLCVKYRRKLLLNRDILEASQKICVEISDRYWFEFKAIGTDGDHGHLFLGAAPRYCSIAILRSRNSYGAVSIGVMEDILGRLGML